ncbi:MAG: ATP-binding cassette domain-containing protein, partial [Clostridia bacterium]
MSKIQITDLTYRYPGCVKPIFEKVSFVLDSHWKLGFIGRNGAGKTTFLNLLLGKESYQGQISKPIECLYFPYEVKNKTQTVSQILEQIEPEVEVWKIQRELQLLGIKDEILERVYETLSGGEQAKVMLASLFAKEDVFLLLDEPTNHLDQETKKMIQVYLAKKSGFILVSHDRELLDKTVDHILAINRTNIEITKGNYSVWKENKDRKEHEEFIQNEVLQKDIGRLQKASKNTVDWSDKVEKTKCGTRNAGLRPDRGYIGHQSAKMMKRAKTIEARYEKEIKQKENLLRNVEKKETLMM